MRAVNAFAVAVLASETVALCVIVHLWVRRKMRWWIKLLWMLFLCVPFLGPLMYGFISINPDSHDDNPEVGPYSSG